MNFSFLSMGGSGEVGMNCLLFFFGDEVVPVDAGVVFADANDFGIEALHPDFEALLQEHRPKRWFITHGHEDHIGAVAALFSAAAKLGIAAPQVFAPPFAAALIREKVMDDARYPAASKQLEALTEVEPDTLLRFDLDEGSLSVRFIEIRHSTLQCCSLAFEWESAGRTTRVLHTSDFKIDSTRYPDGVRDVTCFDAFSGARPDFLFIDSTNSEREGRTVPEAEILPGLAKLIDGQPGRVFVSLFSSNVFRMAAIMKLAGQAGRFVSLAGRSFMSANRIARDRGFYARYCPDFSGARILDPGELARHPPQRQLVLCSGSQGERRSVLMRLSQGQHPDFRVDQDDAVILSSKTIPGNEKPISRMVNGLLRQGAKVYWGDYAKIRAGGPIHGSGHARREELRELLRFVKPAHVIPVHGELRQLMSCAELARETGTEWGLPPKNVHVVENRCYLDFQREPETALRSEGNAWRYAGRRPLPEDEGRILRFENFTAPSRDPFLRVRKRAALGGCVSVTLDSIGRASIRLEGVLPTGAERAIDALHASVEEWLHQQYKHLSKQGAFGSRRDPGLEDSLSDELSRHVRRSTGIRPYVVFHLLGL
jgi:ribonuclease J